MIVAASKRGVSGSRSTVPVNGVTLAATSRASATAIVVRIISGMGSTAVSCQLGCRGANVPISIPVPAPTTSSAARSASDSSSRLRIATKASSYPGMTRRTRSSYIRPYSPSKSKRGARSLSGTWLTPRLACRAFMEDAGERVIVPGQPPNVLLELLRAKEWLVDPNSRALPRMKLQDSVPRVDRLHVQRKPLYRADVTPSERPKAQGVCRTPHASLEKCDFPDPAEEPQARE